MLPLFPKETLLVFDPDKIIADGSYVLAFLIEHEEFVFKRIFYEGTKRYLRSTAQDTETINAIKIGIHDVIIGSLVQATVTF